LFERDPEGAVLAFADMMKKGIVMPAHFMDDGWHGGDRGNKGQNLFVDYATVADSIGVYTTGDYADIVEHLVQRWNVPNLKVSSGSVAEAQEYLCKHSERIRRLADLQMERRLRDRKRGKSKLASFSWIFKREVSLV
jgi:acyl-[acyl-carrier-protein] desaturase